MNRVRGNRRGWKASGAGRLVAALSALGLFTASGTGFGAELNVGWTVATAYPRDTAAGEAVDDFARALTQATAGTVKVHSQFDKATGLDDVQMPVRGGDAVTASVLFAGDLTGVSPVFQLSMLPLDVRSVKDAQRLACLAVARYRAALAQAGYVLLVVVPWPPTGIWTRASLETPDALSNARVRTYDEASRNVFSSVSGEAVTLPIRDTMRELADGKVDAVLSSGDGEAGRSYAKHLKHFTAIRYAFPLSFMVMRRDAFDALSSEVQQQVIEAAGRTEEQLWKDLPSRIRRNTDQMERMGIQVTDAGDPVMSSALRAAGDREIAAWQASVSAEDQDIVRAYQHPCSTGKPNSCDVAQLSARASDEGD